jgi:hypothetical protein
MAADDITLAEFHFEGPTSAASFGIHYQETTGHDASVTGTKILAESLDAVLTAAINGVLSDDWSFASITVRVKNATDQAIARHDVGSGTGDRTGPSLPANMAWLIKQSQALFSPKHNGRIYIPGIAEGDTLIGVLTNAFATGPAATLSTALGAPIPQTSAGSGIWEPGIINRLVLDAAPPAKDWDAAFSPVATTNPWTIISSQRRRTTRVVGSKG